MFRSCGNMCWILKGWHFHASSEGTEEQCHWWSLRMDATRGAFKNSLYQEIKQFSPLWKHWGCQQRKLNWNSGVPGTRVSLDWCGREQVCHCLWASVRHLCSWQNRTWWEVFSFAPVHGGPRWLLLQDCESGDSDPTHHQLQGGAWSTSPPQLGNSSPMWPKAARGDSQNSNYWKKEQSPFPWITGYQVAWDCRSGIWGWSHHQRKQEADERNRMRAVLIVAPTSSYAWS